MNAQEFEFVVEEILDTCKDALGLKAAEYSKGGDRLHNFYRAAEKRAKHPLDILLGFQVKHRVSIDDICGDIIKEEKYPTDELLMEKIKDDINYNILCYALIMELREKARGRAQEPKKSPGRSNVGRRVGSNTLDFSVMTPKQVMENFVGGSHFSPPQIRATFQGSFYQSRPEVRPGSCEGCDFYPAASQNCQRFKTEALGDPDFTCHASGKIIWK